MTQQCFALLPQLNFPANNLNFHWRWSWWDWIQTIFLNLFYFNRKRWFAALQKMKFRILKSRRFVDSGLVKTCDEFVIRPLKTPLYGKSKEWEAWKNRKSRLRLNCFKRIRRKSGLAHQFPWILKFPLPHLDSKFAIWKFLSPNSIILIMMLSNGSDISEDLVCMKQDVKEKKQASKQKFLYLKKRKKGKRNNYQITHSLLN